MTGDINVWDSFFIHSLFKDSYILHFKKSLTLTFLFLHSYVVFTNSALLLLALLDESYSGALQISR